MERARVVLVTNVGQGFGRAVALAYGRAGYHVVCADRDVDLASKTAAEVEELGGQAIPIQADMTTQMDVLTTYQKVLEIFGALGGVVHLATQVSTASFENLTESEFFDVMAENVRSTFLVLKTAARLLSLGWVVVVAPPSLGAVQMMTVQGALEQMVRGFRQRFSYPRVNLVLPSRASADPRHDQALVRAVRYLGSHESVGVSGQLFDVELPEPPQVSEALLPEVRAALDTNVRQDDYGYLWGTPAPSNNGFVTSSDDDDQVTDSMEDAAGYDDDSEEPLIDELSYEGADEHDGDDVGDDDDGDADGYGHGRAVYGRRETQSREISSRTSAIDSDADSDLDDDYDDYAAFDLHWSQELGLASGPALRHVVGDELDGFRSEEAYAAGLEPAVDLYGDLTRLEGEGAGEFAEFGSDDDRQRTLALAPEPGTAKKRN